MPLEKLPVPELALTPDDKGIAFQEKMNASFLAMRDAIIAYNNQIDAALTVVDFTDIATPEDMQTGANNNKRVTPAGVHYAWNHLNSSVATISATNAADIPLSVKMAFVTLNNASCALSLLHSSDDVNRETTVILIQGSGANKVVWPSDIRWVNSLAPVLSWEQGSADIVTLLRTDVGIFGFYNGGWL